VLVVLKKQVHWKSLLARTLLRKTVGNLTEFKVLHSADSKELWSAVRHITGCTRQAHNISGIDADTFNSHYANVSTDTNYTPPSLELTTVSDDQDYYISERSIFKALDTLRPTATGLDRIPAWFLRLGAAVFCKPLAYLFNQSIAASFVPLQWKQAITSPIAKSPPKGCSDFRPISVTPVLTRVMERLIIRQFLYPALLVPSCNLTFSDQYTFCPTGSTTVALVQLFHTVTELLSDHPYVVVIALDFSKAFDMVRHVTVLQS